MKNKGQEKEICMICLEETTSNNKNTVFSKIWNCECISFFHTKCIYPWIVNTYKCPICKQKFKEIDIANEYKKIVRNRIRLIKMYFFYISYIFLVFYFCKEFFYYIIEKNMIQRQEERI